MRKFLVLFVFVFFVVGCETSNVDKGSDSNADDNILYTNKYECKRESTLTKYNLEHRDSQSYTMTPEELEERENSPIVVNKEQLKIYDFSDDGSKLLKYLDVEKYEYLVEIDMQKEKEYFEKECQNYSKERYESCKVVIENNLLTITKTNNLKSEMNKDMAKSTTKASIIEAYSEDELFTCE